MGTESELRLSLLPAAASRLIRHPLLAKVEPVRRHVVHTYYDTADQRLRRERVVVRYGKGEATVRRFASLGSRQTQRSEWELLGVPGALDFSQVDDSALRQLLETVQPELRAAFTANFHRRAWHLEPGDGVRIGLVLDRGWIGVNGTRQTICELRLDLLSGVAADLFSTAAALQADLPLHPEPVSRFQRGYRALVSEPTPVVKAMPIDTSGAMTVTAAFRTIGLACLNHLQSNEQGLHESDNPEFVHQARVAIRRLRSALRVWRKLLPDEFATSFDPRWQALARHLGETRNWDVYLAETLPTIVAAFPESACADHLQQHAWERSASNRLAARRALKSFDYSRLLLGFTGALLALPDDDSRRLETFAPRCLDKRARQVTRMADLAQGGDAAARHRLRVAYKRLRYTLEFFAPLFPGESMRNYHLAASNLQEVLGQLNDLAVAGELTREALPGKLGDPVCDWLLQRTDSLLPKLNHLLEEFRQQPAPWQKGAGTAHGVQEVVAA
ncbi:MAG TPA: CHAD domain-containing protein [Accumulibacter sp.]|uniref:CYTH and CHAD domain-containing protein n=1 Tax=Accumulibacter sp. TaxID=2053492 RepID=UPI0025F2AFAF|nr:CHAD domain-containing protein [Accumulibacter sp.]MCM8599545.1 CHAD domain-containing protein [Accumulibacter sp.]MCM8663514.1 CHAD domain-containing protein [Accumulibacter sp.]HNC50968.1 CHAD domain-containing protein [Accumulibacter sp.]